MNCWGGLKHAQQLIKLSRLPRRPGFACPSCRTAPPLGAFWQCGACRQPFDTFETRGACPQCHTQFPTTMCLDCGEQHPINDWMTNTYAGTGTINGNFSTR
jgi:predicted amidophosphoribosyltransferase